MGSKRKNMIGGDEGADCVHSKRLSPVTNITNRGAWTAEEDRKLAHSIELHGPRRWKSLAIKSGLNRCGKSCRLRWLNYLRPDIKRGNISLAEDDLILRLHRLLGNKWSLIARRLPGRTDNEIKNYWNSHLSRKAYLIKRLPATPLISSLKLTDNSYSQGEDYNDDDNDDEIKSSNNISRNCVMNEPAHEEANAGAGDADQLSSGADDELFDFATQGTNGLEWVRHFLELEGDP